MPESTRFDYWKRLVVEGFVIVVSILLAFAIDAWWDEQRETRDAEDQVARVVAELRGNVAILESQDELLDQTTQAAKEFLSIIGPDAAPVSAQDIGSMIYRIYSVGTLSLSRSATQDFLSSGQLTDGHWIDIRLALTEMLWDVQEVEYASLELRRMRPAMLDHVNAVVPGLDIVREHPVMADYPSSRFESDGKALVTDMQFESLVANYAIRMEINRRNSRSLLDTHRSVIDMIEDTR